jgi:hypothetical protein
MADTKRVIGVAALVTVGVGTANSMLKEQRPPSTRFLIGCGMTFLILSAMAEFPTGEEVSEPSTSAIRTAPRSGRTRSRPSLESGPPSTARPSPNCREERHSEVS